MKTVSESTLKSCMAELFREVEATGEALLVTDNGEMALKIISYHREPDTDESPSHEHGTSAS
jgi:antitoxin (DNA-binding transcriptional repressor) of toxin-antitoxin stability system